MAHKTQEHIYRNAKLKKEKKENEEKMRLTGYTAHKSLFCDLCLLVHNPVKCVCLSKITKIESCESKNTVDPLFRHSAVHLVTL